jgi:hypothetical protein
MRLHGESPGVYRDRLRNERKRLDSLNHEDVSARATINLTIEVLEPPERAALLHLATWGCVRTRRERPRPPPGWMSPPLGE